MTGLDLNPIRSRRDSFRDARARVLRAYEPGGDADRTDREFADSEQYHSAVESALDVPPLLAEIERLTSEVEMAKTQTRKTLRETSREVTVLRAELDKLREWNDEIKAERDDLAMRCLGHESDMREAGAEIRDARAALADALQVIADLRGGTL